MVYPLKTPGTEIGVAPKKPLDIVIKQGKGKVVLGCQTAVRILVTHQEVGRVSLLTLSSLPDLLQETANSWVTRLMNSKDGVPTPEQRKEQNMRKKMEMEKRASMANLQPINPVLDPTGPPARPAPSGIPGVARPTGLPGGPPGRPEMSRAPSIAQMPQGQAPAPARPAGSAGPGAEAIELAGAAWDDDLETLNKCLALPNVKEFINKPNARGQTALVCLL